MIRNRFVFESHEEAYKALEFLKRALAKENKKELKQKEEIQCASKVDTSN